jgi:hypothetical protein
MRRVTAPRIERERVVTRGGEQHQSARGGEDRGHGARDRAASTRARAGGLDAIAVQQRVANDRRREAEMPEKVQPRRGLWPGAEEARGREQAGKGERVEDGHSRAEEIPAGEHEQRARAQDPELAEQQNRRDQIADDERRLVDRKEGREPGERQLRERRHPGENGGGDQHRRRGEPPLAAVRRQRRQEYPGLVRHEADDIGNRFGERSAGRRA